MSLSKKQVETILGLLSGEFQTVYYEAINIASKYDAQYRMTCCKRLVELDLIVGDLLTEYAGYNLDPGFAKQVQNKLEIEVVKRALLKALDAYEGQKIFMLHSPSKKTLMMGYNLDTKKISWTDFGDIGATGKALKLNYAEKGRLTTNLIELFVKNDWVWIEEKP